MSKTMARVLFAIGVVMALSALIAVIEMDTERVRLKDENTAWREAATKSLDQLESTLYNDQDVTPPTPQRLVTAAEAANREIKKLRDELALAKAVK